MLTNTETNAIILTLGDCLFSARKQTSCLGTHVVSVSYFEAKAA